MVSLRKGVIKAHESMNHYLYRFKHALFFLRYKGFRYTYNYLWLYFLFRDDSWIRKLVLRSGLYVPKMPPFVEIEVTTRCNLRCIMCEHTYWKEPQRDMTFEQFKKIVDQFKGLKWIGLTGIGESFLNKDFMKMLRYVKSKGIFVELFDPFIFIDEKRAKTILEEQLVDNLIISLDAATKKTYEKIRVGSDFDKVTKNLKRFNDMKRKMKAKFPLMESHYIINKINLHEMPQYVELMRKLGVDGVIRFTPLLHKYKETAHLFTDVPQEMIDRTERAARKYGIKLGWNKNVPSERAPINDCTLWIMPFIFVTGHVIPCCAGNEANEREFQKRTALGNVFEKPFKEIWNSKEYKRLRKMIRHNKVPEACRFCTVYKLR